MTSTKTPRIALIGCGAIAEEYYLPALASFPAVMEHLTLVDQDRARLDKLSAKYPVERSVQDYHEVQNDADGVIIALPTGLHAPVGVEFLSHAIPVLCEKPLAEDAARARIMIEVAHQHETALAVNYLQRVIPHFAYVKRLLASQVYGRPLKMDYVIGEIFNWPTVSGFYFTSDSSTRGILRDRGAHAVDHICWWLGGRPEVISSHNDSFGGSEAVAHVEFEKDTCRGKLVMSWFADVPCRFSIECEKGSIAGEIYDYQKLILSEHGRKREFIVNSPIHTKVDVAREVVSNFLAVIEKGERPLVQGAEVLESVEFIDEAYEKAGLLDMPWYHLEEVQDVA
jgi:predicted dehydrogenase